MAKLAQEQSAHLYLCLLISDLTQRYGPVIRQAKVVGVLDAAFDVIVPEFAIEKRVHIDQIPIDVSSGLSFPRVQLILFRRIMFMMNATIRSRSTGPSVT
jgi:exoribonuclease R